MQNNNKAGSDGQSRANLQVVPAKRKNASVVPPSQRFGLYISFAVHGEPPKRLAARAGITNDEFIFAMMQESYEQGAARERSRKPVPTRFWPLPRAA